MKGDEAYARPDVSCDGGYAEYAVVKETEAALKPKSVDQSMPLRFPSLH
jgi:NADPH:quinone reductase-like Zn-dependent oxidoreductase